MTINKTSMPFIELQPLTQAAGSMQLPGSKSISNRVLLLSALAKGSTALSGLLDSDDTTVMLQALKHCGVQIDDIGPQQVKVHGVYPFPNRQGELFMGNAGTAIRPLTAALALMGGDFTLTGVNRMHERPIGDLVSALQTMGANIQYLGTEGYPPLKIGQGSAYKNQIVKVRGNVSSQFLTALLMAAPLAATDSDVTIQVEGELISTPYVHITLNMMAQFGVQVQRKGWESFVVSAGSAYVAPGNLHIEGDASSASYFMALGILGGGPVHIQGAGASSIQGDILFADVIESMGATVQREADSIMVSAAGVASGNKLKAFDQDFNHIPDAAMTAAVLALFADAPCTLRNIASWRVKETDRIAAMHTELAKLGAKVESGSDWLRVYPLPAEQWRSAQIATYDDHRMAMCFSLAAFGPVPVTILDPDCVSKTFPQYFNVYKQLVA